MEYGKVCLRRGEELDLRRGGFWIYDNEIDWYDDICPTGGIVDVIDSRHKFVARGYFNPRSKITVRILTRDADEVIDAAFFRRRIEAAWAFRRQLGFSDSCRVVFGESDGLPGLTVDKFGDYLSYQIVSLGMEQWKDTIVQTLIDLFHPAAIVARNDVPVREKEGLSQEAAVVYGTLPELVWLKEHDAWLYADLLHGQKTGHFLDQQENRGRLKPYTPGKTVLDLCCHSGGFGIHAALYGAKSVECVDVSEEALALVRKNAAENGVEVATTCANVFDLVKEYDEAGRQFGLVICDPPAFAKSRKALEAAYRGYKELNLRCLKLTEPGGFLVTCSCSQFMTPPLFEKMLTEAAGDVSRPIRLIETLMQSRDHPACLTAEHALYLKGLIVQVL